MSSPALKNTETPKEAAKPTLVPPAAPAQAAPAGGHAPAPAAPPKKASPMRRILLGVAAIAVLAVGGYYGYNYITVGRFQISTDDAYVKADTSVVSTKVAGLVTETPVLNNTAVKAGDVILKLDDTDYKLALATAKANIATQTAALAVFDKQKISQQAQINAAEAGVNSAQAQLQSAQAVQTNAVQTQTRAAQLAKQNFGTQQSLDDANRAVLTANAGVAQATSGVAQAEASVTAAKAQLDVLDANAAQAQSALDGMQVALQKAQHDLDSAVIKAPFDGVVANRAVAPGEYVGPGTNLLALVPVQLSFITANFKETQISDIHPGQKVDIEVDAFKGKTFEGKVQSVAPASGAEFSLLPPDNATGNFTKITQRIPVKIVLPDDLSKILKPGMSVAVSADLRDKGTDQSASN